MIWWKHYLRNREAWNLGWAYFAKAAFGVGRYDPVLQRRYIRFSNRLYDLATRRTPASPKGVQS